MDRGAGEISGRKFSWRKTLRFAVVAFGVVVLVCVAVLLSFPDFIFQKFVEERITRGFAAAYPAYALRISGTHVDVLTGVIACDSLTLIRNDSSFSSSISRLSVSGIRWLGLLRGRSADLRGLAGSVLEAGGVDLAFRESGYSVRCGQVRVSLPDSAIAAQSVEIHPLMNDEQFFAESRFRKTRFDIGARQCLINGLACAGMLQGEKIHARSLQFQDVSIGVLINKEKPSFNDSQRPRMPNEILSSMKDTVGLDSLIITGGRLKYSESFAMVRKPATLIFDGMQVLITGIASHAGRNADADVQARGIFMGGGTITLAMSIPLSREQFSFRYSGSLSGMDLSRLNPWVEPSDGTRIKTGTLRSARFDINVDAGSATGNVHAVYENLVIAAINSHTGSENGLLDRFSSWVAKNVKIRETNTPDRSGAMKIGAVRYARKKSDPFFGFTWFALRSGVGDLVGF